MPTVSNPNPRPLTRPTRRQALKRHLARGRQAAIAVIAGLPVAVMGLTFAMMALAPSPALSASAVQQLAGRWSGWGSVDMQNGSREQVKCVATFFVENGASRVKQNLRCASAGYKIDVRGRFNVKGNSVSGTWEERNHNNAGTVSGKVSGSTFRLAIRGPVLNASMSLATSACKMNINITPVDFNVRRIAIGLRKC